MNERTDGINKSSLIFSAFENRLTADLVQHTVQTNLAVGQNKLRF